MMNLGCPIFIFMFMNKVVMSLCVRNKVGITCYFDMFINKFICFYHAIVGVFVDIFMNKFDIYYVTDGVNVVLLNLIYILLLELSQGVKVGVKLLQSFRVRPCSNLTNQTMSKL